MKLFAATIATAVLAAGATAQRIPMDRPSTDKASAAGEMREGVRADSRNTRRVMQEFARCLARRDSWHVEQFLDARSEQLSGALGSRAEECLGDAAGDDSMVKGGSDSFRFALAEAFLVRKYHDTGVGDVAAIAPLDHGNEAGSHQQYGLGTLGECIIRKSPAESWTLLRTDAATAAEKIAFASLAPAMQTCVPRGSVLKMPAFFMRGAIAEAYYLLSKAPRLAPGAAK